MKHIKRLAIIFQILLFTTTFYAQTFYKSLEPGRNQLAVYVGSYDWGPCVNKIVINTDKEQKPESLKLDDFEVERFLREKSTGLSLSKGELELTDVFCSDSKGNRVEGPSKYITILADVYPTAENSSPFPGYLQSGVIDNFFNFRVENDDLDIDIKKTQGFVNEDVAKFSKGSYEYSEVTDEKELSMNLKYMFYLPDAASEKKKIPLILWFHSIGESGSNPYLVLLGNKANALAGDKIQGYFEDGAAILAPQCPTGWLETTDENSMGIRYWAPVDLEGPVKKVANPLKKFLNNITDVTETDKNPKTEEKAFAAVSFYTEPVTELLMDFLEKHPEIDRDRVYVGGCSAGGYMTMNMMIEHSELFAAAFPTCEYYLDSKISDSQIKMLSKKPMWFTYAENDETVKPKNNCIPTIERLTEAGAKNLHVSVFPDVVDTSGKVLLNRKAKEGDRDFGKPYEYEGHASWIYVLNDECRDEGGKESLFKWLSRQRRTVEK